MRLSKAPAAMTLFLLAIALGLAQDKPSAGQEAKPAPSEEQKSLIRMDLLQLRKEETSLPQRNIFAPRAAASGAVDITRQGAPVPTLANPDQVSPALPEGQEAAPPVQSVNLRYIGFIESARRMIALVLIEGRAVAVSEGEVVSEGVRVGKITREQVEIILADSSTRAFSLEGE